MTILGITEEHQALREVAWDLLEQKSSLSEVHRIVDGGTAVNEGLDDAFSELGLFGIDVPESLGGGDGTTAHVRQVAEGTGWAAASTRLLGTSTAISSLLASESETARDTWLPQLAEGELGGAVALPGIFSADAEGDGVVATSFDGGWRLDGQVSYVLDAPTAGVLVVLGRTDDGTAVVGLVSAADDSVSVERQEALDLTRTLGRVRLNGTTLPASDVLGVGDAATACVAAATQRGALLLAADSLGVSARVLALTTEYAQQRQQFDRAIGSFQAVKHQAADMLVRTEMARALVDEAATAIDEGRADAPQLVSMAKDYACGAAAWVAGRGIQLHGGIGYTWEHDMHIFFKRAKLNEALFGDRRWHRERIAEGLRAERS